MPKKENPVIETRELNDEHKVLFHSNPPLPADNFSITKIESQFILNFRSLIPEILGNIGTQEITALIDLSVIAPHTRIMLTRAGILKLKEQIENILVADEREGNDGSEQSSEPTE